MIDDKEKTRREIEVLKQEVVKDLEAFREGFQGMTESLAAAKEATHESNAKLGVQIPHNGRRYSSHYLCTLPRHQRDCTKVKLCAWHVGHQAATDKSSIAV